MNKTDLIEAVAKETGFTKKDTGLLVESTLSAIETIVKNHGKLQIIGFGTFEVRERAARRGRNPATGEVMEFPAKKVVRFRPGKNLKNID